MKMLEHFQRLVKAAWLVINLIDSLERAEKVSYLLGVPDVACRF